MFVDQGLAVAGLSYDPVDVLAEFARRRGITFPLLSDPDSAIIRRLGLLNEEVPADDLRQRGMARPGTFLIDADGVVRARFVEEHYVHRVTMPSIIAREFGQVMGTRSTTVRLDHAEVVTLGVQDRVHPGNRVTLIARLVPASGAHLYAPGAERFGYRPVTLTVDAPGAGAVHPPEYPPGVPLRLPGEEEPVPAYTGSVEIRADIVLGSRQEMADALAAGMLRVTGRVALQVCDDAACYAPQDAAVSWDLALETPDTQRVPEVMRREARR